MTSNATSALFDVNVWLALCHRAHPHHALAIAHCAELPPGAFCRLTHLALLRLLTRVEVMGSDLQTPAQAWETYRRFLADNDAVFIQEPDGMDKIWQSVTIHHEVRSANAWADAYLAAFAVTAGMELVTFDRGFRRFKGLHCRLL
jgi:toxin-antitoxin system PIN domain toxin